MNRTLRKAELRTRNYTKQSCAHAVWQNLARNDFCAKCCFFAQKVNAMEANFCFTFRKISANVMGTKPLIKIII